MFKYSDDTYDAANKDSYGNSTYDRIELLLDVMQIAISAFTLGYAVGKKKKKEK